ncbi:LON peptidase substrate-binding domain-containing protein [Bradyrhizobium sp. 21]|uniref:LON peptidase substrate-binding domain-containing protein n=1 Tax=Bradyrhizobium sp. 21 TaxID=2782666 RepID=UPI001FF9EA9C|nr:LON peptidase substrate-binding domain-containing protein [Bradyrhizobium sp. 21]MCK1387343.1 LON peptidase substrate-binding domain-containing protein [Bradyrhizobium sp. 21]
MRDFRDAKAMAQTLRSSLSARAIHISHSESLELVSKMFGVADWNTLSAKIEGGGQKLSVRSDDAAVRRFFAIPMRDLVPFPGATYPVFAGRPKTLQALNQASKQQREIVIAVQKASSVDDPTLNDIYSIGVLAGIRDLVHLHDGTVKALVQIHRRVAIKDFINESESFIACVQDVNEGAITEAPDLIRMTVAQFASYAGRHNVNIPQILMPLGGVRDPDLIADVVSKQTSDPGWVADIIAGCLKLSVEDKQGLLATLDPVNRLEAVKDRLDA